MKNYQATCIEHVMFDNCVWGRGIEKAVLQLVFPASERLWSGGGEDDGFDFVLSVDFPHPAYDFHFKREVLLVLDAHKQLVSFLDFA